MIYESTQNGNVFMLDGAIWATELDSWNKKALIYPLISHEGAKHVLVIGGGDGAVVKYLLEHLELEFVAVYEIDERIMQLWRKFFPSLDRSLDDPKVKVYIEDGNEFMRTQENAFDVIIILSTNVHDNYLVKEYYEVIKKALKKGGVASLIVTGKHTKYVTQCDVMEMDAMDLCDQIFPVVQYFYIPFQEHPGSLTRCIMCSLNPEMNFGHLYEMVLQKCRGKEMTIEEAIIKIFEGCNSSRIDFIKSVLKKKDIHTTEDLKTLDSNALESLSGLTDVEENKIKDFLERAAEEAFAIALKDAHVSRKNFFAEVFRENLALTDLKNLGPKYVVNSFKLLTRSEISKVQEIAENKLRTKFKKDIPEVLSGCKNQGIDLYTHRQNIIREDLLHKPLERCSWFRFELEEAFKRFNDDEIEQMKTFKTRKAIITVERIFKGLDSSRISFIKSVFKEHGISDTFDLKLDLILLEICGKLSTSELQMIKQSYKKWHEMTVEEALVEIFGATEDIRIRLLIEASKKFEDVYMAMEFISLTECITSFDDFEAFTYNEIFKMKKCVEKTLEESVAEALKDSGLLRINFVLKALMRKDLGGACRFIYYGDKLKCDATYPNLLNVFQELSETEISKIMAFHHKSLKEVINEILEGCDGSRIDFVTTTLNKYGIRKQIHLLKYPYELGNIEELTADEVNTIEEFIHKNKDMKHLLEIIGITDVNRITFILRLMKDHCINTSVELLKLDWPFFDILLGLRDSEVKKFKEFIHTKEMTIGETIKKIFKEWDSSRIDFIATTLRKKDVYTTEDLHSLDSNDWEELRGLTGDEVNKIKDFLERGATSESKMEGLNLV